MSLEGKPQESCLEVLVKRRGRPYLRATLDHSPAIIGREDDAAIRLDSKKVSRNHARIEFDASTVRIIDSGSRNGFRVDGEVREKAELSPSNTVKLCDFEFRIRLTSTPRIPAGSSHYYPPDRVPLDSTAPSERARLLAERSKGHRIAEPATKAFSPADDLAQGWAEIARDGDEDTNITRRPTEQKERHSLELGFVERSVLNQLAFARSHADVEAAVGDDLDEDDVDEYIRPDLEPLLKTLHRETESLIPASNTGDVAVEVILAVGANVEDAALLTTGQRYWWGGKPTAFEERFLVPGEQRFPLVTHLQDGCYLVDVPQHPGWRLFRRGKGAAPAHRTGALMGIEANREEQVEVSYGPFTFYIRCVAMPERAEKPWRALRRPNRPSLGALVMSSLVHLAVMFVPVDPLPSLNNARVDTDRFVDVIAAELELGFPEQAPEPESVFEFEPEPTLQPLHEEQPQEPVSPLEEVKAQVDVSENLSRRRRRPRRSNRVDLSKGETTPPKQSTTSADGERGSDAAKTRSRGELSVADFKVTGMMDHLPTVKIDPATGPKLRAGAPVLRGGGGQDMSLLDKSGQGMTLTPPGRLSKAEIRKVVNRNSRDIGRCQARAQKARPDLNGKLVLQWTVLSSGGATDARVVYDDLGSPEFTSCAKAAVLAWIFPEPRGGAATVSYPFKVRNLNL